MARWSAIFDWDGLVVDSSRQHEQAWHRLAQEEQRPLPTGFFRRSFGMKNDKVITELACFFTGAQAFGITTRVYAHSPDG